MSANFFWVIDFTGSLNKRIQISDPDLSISSAGIEALSQQLPGHPLDGLQGGICQNVVGQFLVSFCY